MSTLRGLGRTLLACGMTIAIGAVGCSSEDDSDDAGTRVDSGPVDSGVHTPRPDADVDVDTGPRPDAGFVDTGVTGPDTQCATGNVIPVGNDDVTVDEASDAPANETGAASSISCIGEEPPRTLLGSYRVRSCVHFLGEAATETEMTNDIEVAVFPGWNSDGAGVTEVLVDAARDADWADRSPGRIHPDVVVNTSNTDCPSGVELVIGGDDTVTGPEDRFKTDVPYVFRLSATSSVGPAAEKWATTYVYGARVYTTNLEAGGGAGGNCTPQGCRGRVDLFVTTKAWLGEQAGRAGANNVDLNDGVGDGYAIVQANDCKDAAMTGATAGFAPSPIASAYLDGDKVYDDAAVATAGLGLYMGVGFTDTSTEAGTRVVGAVGVSQGDGSCTEEYNGSEFFVYPDAVTVWRSGPGTNIR